MHAPKPAFPHKSAGLVELRRNGVGALIDECEHSHQLALGGIAGLHPRHLAHSCRRHARGGSRGARGHRVLVDLVEPHSSDSGLTKSALRNRAWAGRRAAGRDAVPRWPFLSVVDPLRLFGCSFIPADPRRSFFPPRPAAITVRTGLLRGTRTRAPGGEEKGMGGEEGRGRRTRCSACGA